MIILNFMPDPSLHAISMNISATTQLAVSNILFFTHGIIAYTALLLRLQRHLANKNFFLITLNSLFLLFSFLHKMVFCSLSHSSLRKNRIFIHIINNCIVSVFKNFSYLCIEIAYLPYHRIFNIYSKYFI